MCLYLCMYIVTVCMYMIVLYLEYSAAITGDFIKGNLHMINNDGKIY